MTDENTTTDKLTAAELASQLEGREYGWAPEEGEEQCWVNSGLCVIEGISDDNVGLYGFASDELGAWQGLKFPVSRHGLPENFEDVEEDDVEEYVDRKRGSVEIEALWCADKDGPAWTFKTQLPVAEFHVMEDGVVFCRGIVISIEDLPPVGAKSASTPAHTFCLTGGPDPKSIDVGNSATKSLTFQLLPEDDQPIIATAEVFLQGIDVEADGWIVPDLTAFTTPVDRKFSVQLIAPTPVPDLLSFVNARMVQAFHVATGKRIVYREAKVEVLRGQVLVYFEIDPEAVAVAVELHGEEIAALEDLGS